MLKWARWEKDFSPQSSQRARRWKGKHETRSSKSESLDGLWTGQISIYQKKKFQNKEVGRIF
jgi:hypothetical protein